MRAWALLIVAIAIAACGGSSAGTPPTPTQSDDDAAWAALEARPLNLHRVRTSDCPVARVRDLSPDFAAGIGDGPFYPVGLGDDATLQVADFPEGGDWLGAKVLWVSAPGFRGRALIRGGRLDADGEVRFGGELEPGTELRIDGTEVSNAGWGNYPSYTRVRSSGCYAYQVDTADFSNTIIFRAEALPD